MKTRWVCACGAAADTKIPAHDGHPAAYYCAAHREAPVAAFRLWREGAMAKRAEDGRAAGRAFWAARGIAVGQPVRVFGSSVFGGRFPIPGVAKVGVHGAYVAARFRGKAQRFAPNGAEAM